MNITEKQFLDEIADLSRSLRAEIEARQVGLDPSPDAIKERRRKVLQGDFQFFAYNYFPHHIRGTPSLFQSHFCNRFPKLLRMGGGVREWWVAPRGEAKSSLLTKIGPVWCAVQALLAKEEIRREVCWEGEPPPIIDYIVLLGAETRLPTKLLEVIKTELTCNASLALDFPEVCGRGPVWKVGEFITKTGVKVEPFGAEQAIRGTFHGSERPKLLLGDDLITDKEAKSPTERENRWNWLEKSIDYLGPPDGSVKYLGVGTVLNSDDPISRAKKSIGHLVHHFKAIEQMPARTDLWADCEKLIWAKDKPLEKELAEKGEVANFTQFPSYQFYLKHQKQMDNGAIISWPSVRSLYVLMRQRAKNKKAFGTEMQGEARSDEEQTFTDIQFWFKTLPHWIYFGGCDPSMGKGETADPSALVVGGLDLAHMEVNVAAAEIKRRVPSKLLRDLIKLQKQFNCQAWGFENNVAFEHMRTTFIEKALELGIYLPLVGVTASVPQEVRIESLEPVICGSDAKILFLNSLKQILEELETFPEPQTHHHYDGLCALQIMYSVAISRAGGIPKIVTRRAR